MADEVRGGVYAEVALQSGMKGKEKRKDEEKRRGGGVGNATNVFACRSGRCEEAAKPPLIFDLAYEREKIWMLGSR